MFPELERPRVTEIQVRMDCNGCVQKIKKALHGINGIYGIYPDFTQQKLTIIGCADPEKIIKAIKKTRKTATICSHSEPSDPPPQPTDLQPPEQPPLPDPENPPPPTEPPPPEPPKDPSPPTPPPEYPPPTATNDASSSDPEQPSRPKDVEEVHVIYHHPPDYGYRNGYGHSYGHSFGNNYGGCWDNYQNGHGFRQEPHPLHGPTPAYVTRGYNTYRPSPNVTHSYNSYSPSPYVTEYEYISSPRQEMHYSRPESYRDGYDNSDNGGNGNITSIFSDENPNACKIV